MKFEGKNVRVVRPADIIPRVAETVIRAAKVLPPDVVQALEAARDRETDSMGKENLQRLLENADVSEQKQLPICQDTGATVVLCEVGADLHFVGEEKRQTLTDAINAGVAKGYTEGLLRASMVSDPLFQRKNTGDNTPAIIHYKYVLGDKLHVIVEPKGFGCENKGGTKMLVPADGVEGVRQWVIEMALKAGPNACPPFVLGVGIGGTLEDAAVKSKWALHRHVGTLNPYPDPELAKQYTALETDIRDTLNRQGLGAFWLGGDATVLAVHIEAGPTHIAGLPVALTISCHATRRAEFTL